MFTPTTLTATGDPAVYLVPEDYVAGTLAVLVDGVVKQPGVDYDVTPDPRTVTFTAPQIGWVAGTWQGIAGATLLSNYLTRELLQARVGGATAYLELVDDDRDDVPDSNVEAYLFGQVDSIADGYLRRAGYVTPVTGANASVLLPYLLNIANFFARTRAGRTPSDVDQKLYQDAMKTLQAIGNGNFELPGFEATSPTTNFGFDSRDTRLFLRNF